jgi:hypothetical protein
MLRNDQSFRSRFRYPRHPYSAGRSAKREARSTEPTGSQRNPARVFPPAFRKANSLRSTHLPGSLIFENFIAGKKCWHSANDAARDLKTTSTCDPFVVRVSHLRSWGSSIRVERDYTLGKSAIHSVQLFSKPGMLRWPCCLVLGVDIV